MYKYNNKLIYRKEDAIIFDTKKGSLIELNESANIIILGIIEGKHINQIIETLVNNYPETPIDEIKKMVDTFIIEAIDGGIVFETAE